MYYRHCKLQIDGNTFAVVMLKKTDFVFKTTAGFDSVADIIKKDSSITLYSLQPVFVKKEWRVEIEETLAAIIENWYRYHD